MTNLYGLDRRVASAFFPAATALYPHQGEAIETILSGGNLILCASTGSGKTEAAVAPLVQRHIRELEQPERLGIVYIAPTKALVNDLAMRLGPCMNRLGLAVGVRHGDQDDLKLKNKPSLVITTPESLDVLLFRKDPALQGVVAVVIDEVHLFYNSQRGLQLSILLHRLEQLVGRQLQCACLSATVQSPQEVANFLLGNRADLIPVLGGTAREIKKHLRVLGSRHEFVSLIKRLVGVEKRQGRKVLLFANSRAECERVAGMLTADESIHDLVFTHYSSLSKDIRLKVERDFGMAPAAICVATSTLELGIDIGDIDAVVLYGPPHSVESLLQRIGRSNRRAKHVNLIALVSEESKNQMVDAFVFRAMIESAERGELPPTASHSLYGAAAQQILSQVGSVDGAFTKIADLAAPMAHQDHLSRSTVDAIAGQLVTDKFLKHHGFKNQVGGDQGLFQLVDYRLIYGNFPLSTAEIPIMHGRMSLGTVSPDNLLLLSIGDRFRFAGAVWRVKKLGIEGIYVEPGSDVDNVKLRFHGTGPMPSPWLSDRIWRSLHDDQGSWDGGHAGTDAELCQLKDRIRAQCTLNSIPQIDVGINQVCYLTFAGYWTNIVLAVQKGLPITEAIRTATGFAVVLPRRTLWTGPETQRVVYRDTLLTIVTHLAKNLDLTIFQNMLPERLAAEELMQLWDKDEALDAILARLAASEPVRVEPAPFSFFMPT